MENEILLGEIDLPDGTLVIIDPGLARFWRHDGEPRSPRNGDPEQFDLEIVGDDATAAGKAYEREFDPLHLYDHSEPDTAKKHFDEFATQNNLQATALVLEKRIPHTERVTLALTAGDGLGSFKYNGLWGVVASGLPSTRSLRVVGIPIDDDEFAGRFQFIDIIVDSLASVVKEDKVHGVMVDHGQLLFIGLKPLGEFRMWESLDGLADFVFWGRDAESVASKFGAEDIGDSYFGWKNVPVDEIGKKAHMVQKNIADSKLRVSVDYRPHCNLERLNAAMRESEEDTAQIVVDGSRVVGCGNRWGDGVFSVSRLLDEHGNVVRIRINLATEKRKKLMRELQIRALGAVVSRKVLDDGEPIRFAERMEQNNPHDSGWCFFSGTEDDEYMNDSKNFAIVQISTIVDKFKELAEILDAPMGASYRRDGQKFVIDE